jgi:hypothetical protein
MGRECPEEEGPPGEPDGVCVGVGTEAFNAWYLSSSVGVTLGVRGVPMGTWLIVVIPM